MFYPSSMPPSSHLLATADRPPSPASSSSSSSSLPQQQLCTSWEQGRCLRGTQCKYLHLSAPSSAPSLASTSASLITSNTFPGFPTTSSAAHHYSIPSTSPSPTSSSPLQPFSLSDLDEYQLDSNKSLRRPLAGLTSRMAGLGFYGSGSASTLGTQRKECWDWLAGRCQRGTMCKYMHAGLGGLAGGTMNGNGAGNVGGSNGMNDNVCHQWARAGQCQYGDVCKFAHISNFPLPPHTSQRPQMTQQSQQSNDYSDDNDYLNHSNNMLPTSTSNYPYMSTAASAPPILFRDSRLGLDTEVCRFYAKHSRCKYSNACKFVHIHHGQGGVQVSGVTVTIAELQRLCALHGPGGIASMTGMSNGSGGNMNNNKMGAVGGCVVNGYDKKAVLALEKEVRELRELKELHDREQRSQVAQQHSSPIERYHPLLPSNSFSSTFSSSSSSPIPQSSPAFSFASTTQLTSSNKSTPPLGGGLNGSFSPSLLHLNGSRQLSDSNKAVGSPMNAFSSSTASAFSSFQLSSAESSPPSGVTTASLFYSHSAPRSALMSSATSAAEMAAADADDDSQLITGSTYAALSGSGALLKGRGGRGDDMGAVGGVVGVTSGVVCDHCGTNGSVWRDSYSNLCDECYTSLLR